MGAPTFDVQIHPGERVVAYGPAARLRDLDDRPSGPDGDRAHEAALEAHRAVVHEIERQHA